MQASTIQDVKTRGLTALEVFIPLAIVALVAAAWLSFSSGAAARYAQPSETESAAREQARRALNEMADELRLADPGSIHIEAPPAGARVRFQTSSGASIVWSAEPSGSAARLVRALDGHRVTIVDGLRPGGFTAKRTSDVLTLSLTVGTSAPLQTAVALR